MVEVVGLAGAASPMDVSAPFPRPLLLSIGGIQAEASIEGDGRLPVSDVGGRISVVS